MNVKFANFLIVQNVILILNNQKFAFNVILLLKDFSIVKLNNFNVSCNVLLLISSEEEIAFLVIHREKQPLALLQKTLLLIILLAFKILFQTKTESLLWVSNSIDADKDVQLLEPITLEVLVFHAHQYVEVVSRLLNTVLHVLEILNLILDFILANLMSHIRLHLALLEIF